MRGVDPLGVYGLVVSLTDLAQRILLSGLQPLVMRDAARSEAEINRSAGTVLVGVTALAALATLLLILLVRVLGYSRYVVLTLSIAAASLIPGAMRSAIEWIALALEKARQVALLTVVIAVAQTVALGAAVFLGRPIVHIFVISTFLTVLAAGLYLALLVRWVRPDRLASNPRMLKDWLFSIGPFVRIGAFGALSRQLDVPLLTQLGGFGATGLYTAGIKLIRPLVLLRPAVFQAFFPTFVRIFDTVPKRSLRMARTATRQLSVLLSAAALMMTILAGFLIRWVYGPDFSGAARVLQIVVWGVPAFYAQTLTSSVLIASDQEKVASRIYAINLLVEVVASLILVPLWGAAGMAVIYVLIRVLGTIQMAWVLRRDGIDLQIGRRALGPMITAAVVGLIVLLLASSMSLLPQLGVGLVGILSFVILSIVFKFVEKHDLDLLRQALRRSSSSIQVQ